MFYDALSVCFLNLVHQYEQEVEETSHCTSKCNAVGVSQMHVIVTKGCEVVWGRSSSATEHRLLRVS